MVKTPPYQDFPDNKISKYHTIYYKKSFLYLEISDKFSKIKGLRSWEDVVSTPKIPDYPV